MSAIVLAKGHWFFARLPHHVTQLPTELTLDDEDLAHHLKTVMRVKPGRSLVIVDEAHAQPYQCTLLDVRRSQVQVSVETRLPKPPAPSIRIIALVSLIKSQRWDWMLQKLTELGVSEIIPLLAERSVIDVKAPEHKQERWQAILRHAAEQSEQARLPVIHPPIPVSEYLTSDTIPPDTIKLVATERDGQPLHAVLASASTSKPVPVLFAVGPEGGWTDTEKGRFQDDGFQFASLGDRILRSETAALYLASVLQYVCTAHPVESGSA